MCERKSRSQIRRQLEQELNMARAELILLENERDRMRPVYNAAMAAYRAPSGEEARALGVLWDACREVEENDE